MNAQFPHIRTIHRLIPIVGCVALWVACATYPQKVLKEAYIGPDTGKPPSYKYSLTLINKPHPDHPGLNISLERDVSTPMVIKKTYSIRESASKVCEQVTTEPTAPKISTERLIRETVQLELRYSRGVRQMHQCTDDKGVVSFDLRDHIIRAFEDVTNKSLEMWISAPQFKVQMMKTELGYSEIKDIYQSLR